MAILYKRENWLGHDLVLEMVYTDVNERYQIVLGKEGSQTLTDGFLAATTTVETPVTIWRAIAAGELSGSEAMMRHQYRVEGDFYQDKSDSDIGMGSFTAWFQRWYPAKIARG